MIGIVAAAVSKDYLYPMNGGVIIDVELEVTWTDDGSEFAGLDWDLIEKGVPIAMDSITITNIDADTPVTLTLSYQNEIGIVSLELTWDHEDATVLNPGEHIDTIITQTIMANGEWSYWLVITAIEATP